MAQRVTKSVRLLPGEWEVVERAAAVAGVSATTWLREVGLRVAREGLAALEASEGASVSAGLGGAPAARGVGGSPVGRRLVSVVLGLLRARFGNRADLRAIALREIRAGRWSVEGLPVRDPEFVVAGDVRVVRV